MSKKLSNTRERILRATWKLMEAGDAGAVRMSDIASEAKLSRQAVYLHFETRADLLIATLEFIDEVLEVDQRRMAFREAKSGIERIEAFVRYWGEYLPEFQGVARALLAMKHQDEAARQAWDHRMNLLRRGCGAALRELRKDGHLADLWDKDVATELFWSMLSFEVWDTLTQKAGWSNEDYIDRITAQAILTFAARA